MDTSPAVEQLRGKLEALAAQTVDTLPNLHHQAHAAAVGILRSMHINDDPDLIWWHRFNWSATSPLTFTGFRHGGVPVESMTFTQLLLRRFNAHDQDNSDVLNSTSGFYRDGPQAHAYDERNEIRLLPQKVLYALWDVDFAAQYRQQLSAYWQTDQGEMRASIRIIALASAVSACANGQLTPTQLQDVFDGLGVDQPLALTLAELEGMRPPLRGVRYGAVRVLDVDLVNVFCLWLPAGGLILYLAGQERAFEYFADEASLRAWLHGQLADEALRLRLLGHAGVLAAEESDSLLQRFVEWAARPLAEFTAQVRLRRMHGDSCAWLTRQVQLQMFEQADLLLHSNAELRQQMWIGYLRVGLRLASPFLPMGWPLAVVAVIAGIAELGLNINQAVNAHSPSERRAYIVNAITGGIALLLNALLLIPLVRAPASALKRVQAPLLAPKQAPLLADARGVLTTDSGQFIRMNGGFYAVRYDERLACWLVVDPERPFSFYGNYPVRFNAALEWEQVDSACLRGGGPCFSRVAPAPRAVLNYDEFDVPMGEYEVPPKAREAVRELLGAQFRRALAGDFYDPEFHLNPVLESLLRLRAELIEDATRFMDEMPGIPARSALFAPDPELPADVAFRRMFDDAPGVVIGESHQSIASKRFLMENLPALARHGVDTLYLEHLMSDLHQLELDQFANSGRMPTSLQDYLRDLDVGHHTDPQGQYTFTRLVQAAQANGIRVVALDCAASYRLDGLEHLGGTLRQRLFSAYASRQIGLNQAAPGSGKWLALVGDSHVSTYKGVPGLAQLTDVTGLRIVDAGAGQATNMTLDPGEYYLPSMGKPDGVVRADWRLALQTRAEPFEYLDPSLAPPGVFQP